MEDEYCWNCLYRIGEECDISGNEVYPDTEACDRFDPVDDSED